MKKISIPQNYKLFFIVLSIIAVIAGAIFYFKLGVNDQELIKTYIDAYFINSEYSIINIILLNLLIFILIWIFGLSMFGSGFIVFIYFIKMFLLSLSVSAIVKLGGEDAILKAFLYVFPSQIVSIFIYALLAIYALNSSFMFFKILFKKREINFKNIFVDYNKIFGILFGILLIVIVYQVYLNPFLFNLFFK